MKALPAHTVVIFLAAVMSASSSSARTATNAERAACEAKVQRKIDAIDARMRLRYNVREGERMRERRRQLEEDRANCRTMKGPPART